MSDSTEAAGGKLYRQLTLNFKAQKSPLRLLTVFDVSLKLLGTVLASIATSLSAAGITGWPLTLCAAILLVITSLNSAFKPGDRAAKLRKVMDTTAQVALHLWQALHSHNEQAIESARLAAISALGELIEQGEGELNVFSDPTVDRKSVV